MVVAVWQLSWFHTMVFYTMIYTCLLPVRSAEGACQACATPDSESETRRWQRSPDLAPWWNTSPPSSAQLGAIGTAESLDLPSQVRSNAQTFPSESKLLQQ